MPHANPLLQRFIEDELARAPLLIEQVLQSLADEPLRFPPESTPAERQAMVDARKTLETSRSSLVRAFSSTLREQIHAVAQQQAADAGGTKSAGTLSLSLVDENEVLADVELSRAVEIIHSVAEYELRELGAFTSALVGDLAVAYDTNPFRPEAYARALWAAATALPGPRAQQVSLMRQATTPLAQALRKAYAAACTRLESQGVEPGTYRTIVLPSGSRSPRPPERHPPADLNMLRDSMPVPLDMAPPPPPPPRAAPAPAPQRAPAPEAPASRSDQQLVELMTRLFDAILGDRAIPADVQLLLTRLQASALRVALRDPTTLDSYAHPVWQFMDRLAFDAERLVPEAEHRERLLQYGQSLVDNMTREPAQEAKLYRWALSRLQAFENHLLAQHCGAVQPQIDSLRALAAAPPPPELRSPAPGTPEALDIGSLDTVPADLMDAPSALPSSGPADASRELPAPEPGQWLRVFLQGNWRDVQLLWTDKQAELWLYRQGRGGRTWALRRGALERLHAEGLAHPLQPRSLLHHAAQQVLRQIPLPGSA